ncbi:uncharacterized protein N7477_000440 [Penicillium maclennaniae]|uniref:uncharacterized protein n=1 Tax=Penicillium maclennaniae TaxID=1343394 RepID=UPI00253F67CD|nr:uncharacterized protein N7477_000440 [Penicillium maclennaniae]KAJ5684095.1 hypothetical protein N7477_000440 [Penicillium maclennaniae]
MCPMMLNRLSDGPAMVLSSSQEHAFAQFPSQSALDRPGSFHSYPASPSSVFASNAAAQSAPSSNVVPAPFAPKPSRKRSRDEAAYEVASALNISSEPAPPPAPKEEPIYGEGMVLLNPSTGMAISADSQTGTWYEEQAEAQQTKAPPVSSRSFALQSDAADISRKSQRLDRSAPGLDDIALCSIQQRLNGPEADQHRTLNTGPAPPAEPLIDDATRLLGISWQRLDTDGDMAPAVRGWTKYIDNQYSDYLRDSQMLIKSRALNAYLVAAVPTNAFSPAFYLFSDDLTQAQLVASSWEACLHNLRSTPIIFEGSSPLVASSRSNSPPAVTAFGAVDGGVPLLHRAISNNAPSSLGTGMGLNEGVEMGMEIDS